MGTDHHSKYSNRNRIRNILVIPNMWHRDIKLAHSVDQITKQSNKQVNDVSGLKWHKVVMNLYSSKNKFNITRYSNVKCSIKLHAYQRDMTR